MTATGYDVEAAPAERRALGYRWEDGAWKLEPTMAHGAFGAMGGIQTSATDYAKWVAYLLSAWPPRDGADTGPVRRSSVRELAQGAQLRVGAAAPGRERRRRLPVGGRLRHGHERGGGLRARAHAESRRRLSRLRIARAAAARLRRRDFRAGQSHLRRSAQPGVGRRCRPAAGRRGHAAAAPPCRRALRVPTVRSARCGRPGRSRLRPTHSP